MMVVLRINCSGLSKEQGSSNLMDSGNMDEAKHYIFHGFYHFYSLVATVAMSDCSLISLSPPVHT
jgi:hypothetical protein